MSRQFAIALAVFGAMVAATAAVGGRFTASGLGPWYDGLAKPAWTPPGSVIGIVWGVLFLLVALASALVWSAGPARGYLALLIVNLILNAGWSYLFFVVRAPAAALAELLALALTCLGLIHLASQVSTPAAWLLVPYAAWVAFAGFLNWSIVRLR